MPHLGQEKDDDDDGMIAPSEKEALSVFYFISGVRPGYREYFLSVFEVLRRSTLNSLMVQ